MNVNRILCENCGGNLSKRKNGLCVCEFCGSQYMIDANETVTGKVLTDIKLVDCYEKATEYRKKHMYSKELGVLAEALALDEDNVSTLVKMGRCYRSLGFNEKAMDIYRRAIEIDPGMGTAYTNIGTIYILKKEWSAAAQQYEKGLPYIEYNSADYWVAYTNYAIVLAKLGNPARAEEMIAEAEKHGYKNGDKCRDFAGIKKRGFFRLLRGGGR